MRCSIGDSVQQPDGGCGSAPRSFQRRRPSMVQQCWQSMGLGALQRRIAACAS